jgi:HAE1 family hydrophobic/amphiphilic exporter-1
VLEIMQRVEGMARAEPSVEDIIGVPGFSIFYRYANQGFLYVTLKPWDERKEADQHVAQIIRRLNGKFYLGISEARVFAINEPPISGMGNIAGFDYRLLALDGDRAKLDQAAAAMVAGAAQDARLAGVRNVAAPDVQTLFIDVDRNKAKALGVPLADV